MFKKTLTIRGILFLAEVAAWSLPMEARAWADTRIKR